MGDTKQLTRAPGFRWVMLVLNVLAYGQFFLTVQVSVAFRSYIMEDLGIGLTQAQLFNTIIMGLFAFTPTLGAKLGAKVGLRKNVAIAILCNIAGALLIPVIGHSFMGYAVCCVLQGLCGGLMAGNMIASTTLWFPIKERALATGVLLGILGVGFSIATFFAPRLMATGMSWQMGACLMSLVPAVIILIIYYLVAREVGEVYPGVTAIVELLPQEDTAKETTSSVDDRPKTMAELRKTSMFWAAAIVGFISGCMSYGFPAFVGGFLAEKGLEASLVTTVSSVTFFTAFIGAPLGGIISDKLFKGMRWQTVCLSNALIAAMLGLAVISNGRVLAFAIIAAYFVAAIALGPYWAMPAELGVPEITGEVSGIINVCGNTGGFTIGFILTSIVSLTGSYLTPLLVCLVLAAIAAVSVTRIKR